MQNGAPCHVVKYETEWLNDCCIPNFRPWPEISQDLNPNSEHLGHHEKQVERQGHLITPQAAGCHPKHLGQFRP